MAWLRKKLFSASSLIVALTFCLCIGLVGCESKDENEGTKNLPKQHQPKKNKTGPTQTEEHDEEQEEESQDNHFDSSLDPIDRSRFVGIPNLGNTCFANSLFKALSVHPRMGDFLETWDGFAPLHADQPGEAQQLSQASRKSLAKLLRHLNLGYSEAALSSKAGYLGPDRREKLGHYANDIFNTISNYQTLVTGYPHVTRDGGELKHDQLDVVEFLGYLQNYLGYSGFFPTVEVHALKLDPNHPDSIIGDSLHRPYYSTLGPNTLKLFIKHLDASSVSGAILRTLEQGFLNSDGNAIQRILLVKDELKQHPKQFFIALERNERVGATTRKISTRVEVSQSISLPLYTREQAMFATQAENKKVTDLGVRAEEIKMHPVAVICHIGANGSSGHYVAYTYNEDRKVWFYHNDSSVYELGPKALVSHREQMARTANLILYTED